MGDPVNTHDVPLFVVEKNEADFRALSMQYERALDNLHIVMLVDFSGSMSFKDNYPHAGQTVPPSCLPRKKGAFWTRWDNTCMVAKYLAKTMLAFDKDRSIPVIFYDREPKEEVVSHADEMLDLFKKYKPEFADDMKKALALAFDRHIPKERVGDERTLFIVLHDGASTDPVGTKRLIKERLTSRDPQGDWLNVLFVCMGDDQKAISFLKNMDNRRDIGANVDTKLDNEVYELGPKNLLLNAIFEHIETPHQTHTSATHTTPAAAKGSDKCCVVM